MLLKAIEENQFIHELVFFFSFKYKFNIYTVDCKFNPNFWTNLSA
ncbi:hypothetical protein FM124_01200 [Pediococcus acidilactici]|nr:hypothetical protein FM124_01200 [Pediococcus acidilactici]